jgi:hypothetical protein
MLQSVPLIVKVSAWAGLAENTTTEDTEVAPAKHNPRKFF